MKKINFKRLGKRVLYTAEKYMPEALIIIGIGGMIGAGVMAVLATPEAEERIEAEKERINDEIRKDAIANNCEDYEEITKLTPKELVKTTWKCYAPAAATASLATVCIVGAHSVKTRRHATLAAAYTVTERSLHEYKNKVIEHIGEEAEREIVDAIARDKVKDNPPPQTVMIMSGEDIPCMDSLSGQYFRSTATKLDAIANNLNRRMRDELCISLNDFYWEVGLKQTANGDQLGWNIDKGYIELYYTSDVTDDLKPVLVVNYQTLPNYNFQRIAG